MVPARFGQHVAQGAGGGRGTAFRHEIAARFEQAKWIAGALGQPLIEGATARFECKLATALLWETHYIIVGNVVGVDLSEDSAALLYGQRAYRKAVGLGDA